MVLQEELIRLEYETLILQFMNLLIWVIGRNNTWETLKLELLRGPRSYSFGLGVSIQVVGSLPIEAPLSHIPTSI